MRTKPTPHKISCSVGIFVYNEEKNIKKALMSLLKQRLSTVNIDEIIVVASGSTDRTSDIVNAIKKQHRKITLIRQKKREGKSTAVNLFISKAKNDILVLMGGDLLLTRGVIQSLVEKFSNEEVGMTGAHPIPVNSVHSGFVEFAGNLLWDLHHRISLKKPKMGELVAFRRIFKKIPTIGADEASIEPLIRGQGYIIQYVPEAKIFNRSPATLSDFIKQRRRNYWLHLVILHKQSYLVSTLSARDIIPALLNHLIEKPRAKHIVFIPGVILVEILSRTLGWSDYYITKKEHTVWEVIESTKKL